MEFINRILVVTWLSRHCNNTLEAGISLAQKYKAELTVSHIIDTTWLRGWSIPMVSVEEEHKRDMEQRRAELHEIISRENKKGMTIKELIKEGVPSEVILKLVKDENIDLLILRSSAEGRLERMLVGGSNEEIIRELPCSILLVKQDACTISSK